MADNTLEREYYRKLNELESGFTLTKGSREKLANYSGAILDILEASGKIHKSVKNENETDGVLDGAISIYETLEENPNMINAIYDIFKSLYNQRWHPYG